MSVISNSVSNSFDADLLNTQPLPRNYYNIIRSAPAVNIDYGQSSGSAMLAYGGITEGQNAFTLDGVNVADAGAGQHRILPAIQCFLEIQVGGLGAPAEYGGFTGAIINGVTKSGGNEFHGELGLYYQPASWAGDNDPTTDSDEFKFYDAALSHGGPVKKDKLRYFASLEYWNQITTPYRALDTSDREIRRFLGKLTLQAKDATRVMLMTEYEGLENERRGIDASRCPGRRRSSRRPAGPSASTGRRWSTRAVFSTAPHPPIGCGARILTKRKNHGDGIRSRSGRLIETGSQNVVEQPLESGERPQTKQIEEEE